MYRSVESIEDGGAAMGKNGGKANDTILTLEEALIRFKRKRETGVEVPGEGLSASGIQLVNLDAPVADESRETEPMDLETVMANASISAQREESAATMKSLDDVVAVIEGIPRTMEELELMAAAEEAYRADFEATEEYDDEDDVEVDVAALANRHALIRDYAFTAMGSALMVLVVFLMTRVPVIHPRPDLAASAAHSVTQPALQAPAPTLMSEANNLITSLVTVPPPATEEAAPADSGPTVKSAELESRIKNTLKSDAFNDIGVSVSHKGDAYLAGEVYSMNEANRIAQIVHSVNGVSGVHFDHPNVVPSNGPAYLGVRTAKAANVWGAKVKSVIIGSPADKAGLKAGDVISEFDGNTVPDSTYLDHLVAHYSPGQRVEIRVWHDGQPEYLVARLGELTTVASR